MIKKLLVSSLICFSGLVFSAEQLQLPKNAHPMLPRDAAALEKTINELLGQANISLDSLSQSWHNIDEGKSNNQHTCTVHDFRHSIALLTWLTSCKHVMDTRKARIAQLEEQLRERQQSEQRALVVRPHAAAGAGAGQENAGTGTQDKRSRGAAASAGTGAHDQTNRRYLLMPPTPAEGRPNPCSAFMKLLFAR